MDTNNLFEVLVFSTKFVFVFVLMILSKINHEIQYIQDHPSYLTEDAIVCGFTSVLSACVVEFFRQNSIHAEGMILIFAFFFMYSVLRELSGYFVTSNKKEQEEFKQLKWVCITVLVLGIVTCCVFAFINRVIPTPSTYKLLSENTSSNGVFGLFMLEMVLFTLSLASGELFVMNRHEPVTWKSIGATCALSALLHTVFQLNGFYSVTFKE